MTPIPQCGCLHATALCWFCLCRYYADVCAFGVWSLHRFLGNANPCSCNGAWVANPNGTITSTMDGNCFETSGSHVSVSPCVAGSPSQKFELKPKGGWYTNTQTVAKPKPTPGQEYTIQQNGLCVDNNRSPPPPGPPPPMPGPGGPSDVVVRLADLKLGFTGAVRVRDVWGEWKTHTGPSNLDVRWSALAVGLRSVSSVA